MALLVPITSALPAIGHIDVDAQACAVHPSRRRWGVQTDMRQSTRVRDAEVRSVCFSEPVIISVDQHDLDWPHQKSTQWDVSRKVMDQDAQGFNFWRSGNVRKYFEGTADEIRQF